MRVIIHFIGLFIMFVMAIIGTIGVFIRGNPFQIFVIGLTIGASITLALILEFPHIINLQEIPKNRRQV